MRLILFFLLTGCLHGYVYSQGVAINTDGSNANASSILDIKSADKGILTPRMTTTQRNAIVNPERGLLVFDTDKGSFFFYDGVKWRGLGFLDSDNIPPVPRNASDPKPYGYFGASVSVTGDYMAVGSMDAEATGVVSGAVYVFKKGADGNWTEQEKIVAPDAANSDRFGFAVDMDGDYLIVGAPEKNVNGNYAQGKAYVYKRQNNSWLHQVTLSKAGAGAGDRFGYDVAITTSSAYGVLALAGVPYYDNGLQNRGIIYLYRLNPATQTWSGTSLSAPVPQAESRFGFSVDADGDNMLIGAPWHDQSSNDNSGIVYLYHFNGNSWVSEGNVPGTAGTGMGYSVSISGNLAAFGAPLAPTYSNTGQGAVFLMERNAGGAWL